MRISGHAFRTGLLGFLVLAGTGCNSIHSHGNRPWDEARVAPDCRASLEIQEPRGEEDVLVLLCLSGGGSRASWFSAATMLRLEQVLDERNLLHEVDVISSVSGGSLPAAYYCVTRDAGPYSVVRVENLPERLPSELEPAVKMDRERGLLGVRGKMSAAQRDLLRSLFASGHDQARVERLFWLSTHTRAPAVWQPEAVRDLMTRDYIQSLLVASFSPLNAKEDWLYWTTAYDRSDQMANIFKRNLFGAKLVHVPRLLRDVAELEFLGPFESAMSDQDHLAAPERDKEDLRWPTEKHAQVTLQLDWLPGYPPTRQTAQHVASGVVSGAERVAQSFRHFLPYRFKDLNPERPYLILNATNGSEDDPGEPHFGEVFTFTREEFKRLLNSTIDDYPVAWGVMASAAFPAVFSFVTLKDYRSGETNNSPRFMHVFDGGNSDNLGLISAKRIILANRDRYRHFVVVLVDSHISKEGASRDNPDVRSMVVDMNFMSSYGTLLRSVRQRELDEFTSGYLDGQNLTDKLTFWHLAFEHVRDAELRDKANSIPTTFQITPEHVKVIEQCVYDLVRPDSPRLQEFLRALRGFPKTAPAPSVAGPDSRPGNGRTAHD